MASGGITRASAAIEQHEAATRGLRAEVARRLALSPRKEVVLYVHGYHNTFSDAALTMGELCQPWPRIRLRDLFVAGGRQ